MTEETKMEMISRRKALSLLGLGAASASRYRRRSSRQRPKRKRLPRPPPPEPMGCNGGKSGELIAPSGVRAATSDERVRSPRRSLPSRRNNCPSLFLC